MGRGVLLPHARRLMLFLRPMGFSTSASVASTREPLHVCVVGSGPAGFYMAEKMLKGHEGVQVDIIDRLPTPFGLVRSGVAPDHPETKIVVNQFSRVAANARCSFFGNVTLGSDVSLSELQKTYDVVVLAYGAESDRLFGIPGEDLRGIHSAREFVWWYNGHPDMCNLAPDLKNTDSAVVLGQGNVALDVARILLRCTTELSSTDIASYALDALRSSTVRKVFLVGRRGPVQAACTAKELREILGLKNVHVCIKEADLVTSPADQVWAVNCGSSCTLLMAGLPSTVFFINITSPVSGIWQIWVHSQFLFTGSSCPAGASFFAALCLFCSSLLFPAHKKCSNMEKLFYQNCGTTKHDAASREVAWCSGC